MDWGVLASARHGVVSAKELRALGLSQDSIERRARNGRLHRIHPGVYAVGRPELDWPGRLRAAALSCGECAAVSHLTAAREWGLTRRQPARIHVIAPRSAEPKLGVVVHRPRRLDVQDILVRGDVPLTTVARTLLDCAEPRLRVDIGALLHEAEVQRVLDMDAVWEVLARRPHSRGARRLAVAAVAERPFTRSGLERAFVRLAGRHRLPAPRTNQHVFDGDRLVEVDFLWPAPGVIVEVDGGRYHATRWRRRRRRRQDRPAA